MKTQTLSTLFFTLVIAVGASAQSESHDVDYGWYSNLWQHADLVIIGSPTSARYTGERRKLEDEHQSVLCEAWETTFHIELLLKGTNKAATVTLLHYRQPKDSKPFTWLGPKLASFHPPLLVETDGLSGDFGAFAPPPSLPDYLLFLKRAENGLFTTVSGQTNSALSVRDVYDCWGQRELTKTQPRPGPAR